MTPTPSAEQKKSYWQRPNNYIRMATLAAVGLYTVLTYCQLNIIRSDNIAAQRAYVFLHDIDIRLNQEGIYDIIPLWKNSGNSETVNMRGYLSRYATEDDLPHGFSFGNMPGDYGSAPLLLGPRQTSTSSFMQIDGTCLRQFNARYKLNKFYLWGWVQYNDTLSDKRHITRFCWDISKFIFSDDRHSARLGHFLCGNDETNCADDQCRIPQPMTIVLPKMKPCEQPPETTGK